MKVLAALSGMLALLAVTACVPLAIGGVVAGAYYIGKDERPVAVIADDSRITTTVRSRLIADKYVDAFQVSIETYDGIVTLAGEVGSSIPRDQAERLAASVEGVKSVRNEIRVVRKPAQ